MALDFAKIGAAAVESDDLTVNKSFERPLPRSGVALLRLLSYIETGRHAPQAGSTYKPALKTILTFELSHVDHLVDFDGKLQTQQIQVRLGKGGTLKSGYHKLFNVMNAACGNRYNHFIQMIGQPFLGKIYHNTTGEGDKKKTYANLDNAGAWSLEAPVQINAVDNTFTPIPVRELEGTPKAFLWENTSVTDEDYREMWDSIHVEGTRMDKDNVEVSKNWLQELIMTNMEWEGSTAQALFDDSIITLSDDDLAPPATLVESPPAQDIVTTFVIPDAGAVLTPAVLVTATGNLTAGDAEALAAFDSEPELTVEEQVARKVAEQMAKLAAPAPAL